MGAITSMIHVGRSHPYEGGLINLEYVLSLSENGVARWSLASPATPDASPIGWIPDPDTMLEDGLLLLGLYVWKDEELLAQARRSFLVPLEEVGTLHERTIRTEDRLALHRRCRSALHGRKLAITVLGGSSLLRQLEVLERYSFETEVCVPKFARSWNVWTGSMDRAGEL